MWNESYFGDFRIIAIGVSIFATMLMSSLIFLLDEERILFSYIVGGILG